MDSRERVLTSLDHKEPDRVPLFSPNIIDTAAPYDPGLGRFLDAFPFDRLASPSVLVGGPATRRPAGDGTFVDGYGCEYRYMGVGLPYCIHSPLAAAESLAEIEAFAWPDPHAPGLIAPNARAEAQAMRDAGNHALSAGLSPIFHQYHYLRGFAQWMMDIRLNRAIHEGIAENVARIHSTLLMRALEEVGDLVDMVSVADDLGTSTAPFMSPADFRTLIKPHYHDVIGRIKHKYPDLKFYLHSHGQIMDLVPDFIECGVDVLNPILPLDNMDPVRLKKEYGDSLCFHGGIDIEHILPFGTVAEVTGHVKRVIDILAPGGGYWFKLQAISPVIPAENVIAAYETAFEYGQYDA